MALELKSARPASTDEGARQQVRLRVAEIVTDIRTRGEAAVRSYSRDFDRWEPASFRLSDEEIDRLVGSLPRQVIDDIDFVQNQGGTSPRCSESQCSTSRWKRCPAYSSVTVMFLSVQSAPTSPAGATRSPPPPT